MKQNKYLGKSNLKNAMNLFKSELNKKENPMTEEDNNDKVKDLWYEGEKYKSTFTDENGNIIYEQNVIYGDESSIPEDIIPTKESTDEFDYEFDHWNPDPKDLIKPDMDKPVVFTPVFKSIPRCKTIRLFDGDGSVLYSYQVTIGRSLQEMGVDTTIETEPTKAPDERVMKYTWNKKKKYNGWDKSYLNTIITDDMDVYPVFDETLRVFTVNFIADGKVVDTQQVEYGYYASEPWLTTGLIDDHGNPIKESDSQYHYTFYGWGENGYDGYGDPITEDTTINALFDTELLGITVSEYYRRYDFLDNWDYELDGDNIILKEYNADSNSPLDIIVYDRYIVNGKKYKSKIVERLHIYGWDTKSVVIGDHIDFREMTSCKDMFDLRNASVIDLGKGFDTSNVTTMEEMFSSCNSVEYLDLSMFDTSKVTNMLLMFDGCNALTEIKGLENFDMSNIVLCSNMFTSCYALLSLKGIENWDMSNIEELRLGYMFEDCESLTSLDLSKWTNPKLIDLLGSFEGCKNIETIDLRKLDMRNLTDVRGTFKNCINLKQVIVDRNLYNPGTFNSYSFEGCNISDVTYIN